MKGHEIKYLGILARRLTFVRSRYRARSVGDPGGAYDQTEIEALSWVLDFAKGWIRRRDDDPEKLRRLQRREERMAVLSDFDLIRAVRKLQNTTSETQPTVR